MLDVKTIPLAIRHAVKFIRVHAAAANCTALAVDLDGTLNSVVTLALCRQTQLKTIAVEYCSEKMKPFAEKMGITYINVDFLSKMDETPLLIMKMPSLDSIGKKNSALLVGSFNRDDYRLVRAYHKRAAAFDMLPIADLHMSEVRQLGKFLTIPEEILTAPQSNDSGFSYELLERADSIIGVMASQPQESINIEPYLDEEQDLDFAKALRKIVEIEFKSRHKENRDTPICYMAEHRLA